MLSTFNFRNALRITATVPTKPSGSFEEKYTSHLCAVTEGTVMMIYFKHSSLIITKINSVHSKAKIGQ